MSVLDKLPKTGTIRRLLTLAWSFVSGLVQKKIDQVPYDKKPGL